MTSTLSGKSREVSTKEAEVKEVVGLFSVKDQNAKKRGGGYS